MRERVGDRERSGDVSCMEDRIKEMPKKNEIMICKPVDQDDYSHKKYRNKFNFTEMIYIYSVKVTFGFSECKRNE